MLSAVPSHPANLGKYVVTELIGQGSMGLVYKAVDPVIQRTVAIKMLRRQALGTGAAADAMLARFRNEAKAAGRLMHPGIVTLHDYGEDPAGPFIVMEHVEGLTLKDHLRTRQRLSDDDVVALMTQLLDALQHAHEQKVYHRDIKPANLIITPQGRLKITDFGVARIDSAELTKVNTAIGTPGYMAPEQYTGGRVDGRTDVFASGVLLYQLLTMRSPFGGTDANIMFQTLNSEPMPPSELRTGHARAGFDEVVTTAMAKRSEQRYACAAYFKEALLEARRALGAADTAQPPQPAVAPAAGRGTGGGSGTGDFAATAPGSLGFGTSPLALLIGEAEIRRSSQLLAQHVGPIAKVLTGRAAAQSASREDFHARLLAEIDTPAERDALLRRLQALAGDAAV